MPGAVVVATLPASKMEVANSEKGQDRCALQALGRPPGLPAHARRAAPPRQHRRRPVAPPRREHPVAAAHPALPRALVLGPKVACSRPGLNWSYTDGALLELENRCFYLHAAPAGSLGKRYWFGTQPTLNKLVVQYRQRVDTEHFEEQILESLNERARSLRPGEPTWRVLVDPKSDLPEQKSLTLLVLPPALAYGDDEASRKAVLDRVLEISQRCGGKERHYRNTLPFLAASAHGAAKVRRPGRSAR